MADGEKSVHDCEEGAADYAPAGTGDPYFDHVEYATIKSLVGDVSGKTLLDLACGDGRLCEYFSKMGAKRVAGYDMSESAIERARKRDISRCDFSVMDCCSLNIPESLFDVVTSFYALQFMDNYAQLLAFMKSAFCCLKSGGTFCGITSSYSENLGKSGYNSVMSLSYKREEIKDFADVKVVLGADDSKGESGWENVARTIFSSTYEKCLKEAGFIGVDRQKMRRSDEGKTVFSEEDVEVGLLDYFYVFVARKPE